MKRLLALAALLLLAGLAAAPAKADDAALFALYAKGDYGAAMKAGSPPAQTTDRVSISDMSLTPARMD